jgi:hypothetical protein
MRKQENGYALTESRPDFGKRLGRLWLDVWKKQLPFSWH